MVAPGDWTRGSGKEKHIFLKPVTLSRGGPVAGSMTCPR